MVHFPNLARLFVLTLAIALATPGPGGVALRPL